jgi:CubicO group peptidase (beta-lactamase class C family)
MTIEGLFNGICEKIPDALSRHKVPGAVLGVSCDGQEFVKGFGVTNADHPLPVDEDTLFQIGSTTKTFTATAIMRLVEQGKLKLDEPIRTYLRDFSMSDPAVTESVTMRHLLTHAAGWQGDFFPDTGNGDDALCKYVGLMARLPQLTPLGTVLSYNNSAFSLAGRIMEVVTGSTYETALKELVLNPLGLKRSYLFPTEVMVHRFAVGHAAIDDKPVVLKPWQLTRASTPAGGIVTSIKDQLRYARFHLGDGTSQQAVPILSRESVLAMQTPQGPVTCDFSQGLAWRVRDVNGIRRVFHGGMTFGQVSLFTLVPERQFGFALATNSMNGGLLAREVARDLIIQFLGNDEPEPSEIDVGRSLLPEYCGLYSATLADLEITLDDGKLMMQPHLKGGFPTQDTPPPRTSPAPFRVGFIGPDLIAMVDPPMHEFRGEFLRAPDGAIAWLRWGARIQRRN